MIRSATPVIKISLPYTSASRLNSGPSINSSTTSLPLIEASLASRNAGIKSSGRSILRTPRAPILSQGLITSGSVIELRASRPSSKVQTERNCGTGTPFSCKICRILILSVALSATSKGIPGRFKASATAATVCDASVPTVITPSKGQAI